MNKVYLDMTQGHECLAVYAKDCEIIPAGTTVYSMPVKERSAEYSRFAREYGIHFIFDDQVPRIDFYTIPRVDIMALTDDGGYLGTIGGTCDLAGGAPICYIDRDQNCYLAAADGKSFLENVACWKSNLKRYEGIYIFSSAAEAKKNREFLLPKDVLKAEHEKD